MRKKTTNTTVCIDLNDDLWHDKQMDSHTKQLLQGTFAISVFFLSVCLIVHFFLPAAPVAPDLPVTAFSSFTSFDDVTPEDALLVDYSAKTDFPGDFSSRDDRGLALYRQPQSRAAVEWFYTHVTSSREVASAILENADRNDIPVSLAFALAYVESNYKSTATNHNSNYTIDRGLFQLNSASFPRLREDDFFNPKISAKYGMMHLRFCLDVAGNEITGLAMYNAGTNRVRNNKTPQMTLNYVGKIEKYRAMIDGMFSTEVLAFYDNNGAQALAKR
jgi:hypothetical protein